MHYWDAIGIYSSYYFCGSYDGGNFTISGLYTEKGYSSSYSYQGLFGYVVGQSETNMATIKNVGIIDSNIQGYQYVGGVVGYANSYSTITNCYNISSVSGSGDYVGGVAGWAEETVTNCYNEGVVRSSGSIAIGGVIGCSTTINLLDCYNTGLVISEIDEVSGFAGSPGVSYDPQPSIGGILGWTRVDSIITNCYNVGDVIVDSNCPVGGILGSATTYFMGLSNTTISNCYNTGSVSGSDDVGGVVGDLYGGDITNCYNTGDITGKGGDVGGIAGLGNSDVANCYNTGSVSGSEEYIGGVVGYSDSYNVTNCYNTGVVTGNREVGGVVGRAKSDVANCYNTGSVSGSDGVGGVVGCSESCDVTNCYNTGIIDGSSSVGGVVGKVYYSFSTIANCYNTGVVTGSGDDVGGVVGGYFAFASDGRYPIVNNYYGGNCTLTAGVGNSINTGASKDENLIANAKSSSWYQDSSNWHSYYPWDFENVWSLVSSANDGYPILQGFSVIITYNSNFGEKETITEQVPSGQEIVIAGYDLFTRVGYEISHWNTKSDGTGLNFYAGDAYSEGAGLTLYAIWKAGIYTVSLVTNGGSGGTQKIWVKYGTGFYANSSATGSPITSLTSSPTREGYVFNGYYTSAISGTRLIDSTGKIVAGNTFTTSNCSLYAQWKANNPAYYDEEGGYWYIENGYMPQDKVTDSTLISNINSSSDAGTIYYFAGEPMESKVYNGKEYCQYNGNWYEVMPIRWRLVYSSSQTSGYGTTTDTLAVMAEIVYVDAFSDGYIGAGAGYSNESVTEFMKNQIDVKYLVTESKNMPTFGSTSLNGTPASVSSNIFVASYDDLSNFTTNKNGTDLSNFTTNKNGTEKLGKIKFSDLAKDYLRANGKDTLYYTRDLGKTYNHIYCMNANGDRVQYKANNLFGVQYAIKVTEYACI